MLRTSRKDPSWDSQVRSSPDLCERKLVLDGEVEADPDASHNSMTCFFHLSYRHFFIIYIYIYIYIYIHLHFQISPWTFDWSDTWSPVVTIPCSWQSPKQLCWVRAQGTSPIFWAAVLALPLSRRVALGTHSFSSHPCKMTYFTGQLWDLNKWIHAKCLK